MRMLTPLSDWSSRRLTTDFSDAFDDFDQVLDVFWKPTQALGFEPTYDVTETKDHLLMSFDVPGVKKEDIKIEVQGNRLTISAERQANHKNERSYGKFERSFELPVSVSAAKVEAHYENGVLNLALPKAEAAKSRTVEVQSGHGGIFSQLLGGKKEDAKDIKEVKVS